MIQVLDRAVLRIEFNDLLVRLTLTLVYLRLI